MREITSVSPILQRGTIMPRASGKAKESSVDFGGILRGFLRDVNNSQLNADNSVKKLASGEIADVHEVMLAVEEANITLDLLVEIRNKLLEAYQQLTRIPL
ncbi:MAG: flagellar hook-basal body complex protein FliE [Candidatus Latescibacteria bacterium]|nr:flagellar hook-basal body complex protein FliE [Candidatus Latescibacterota bacterium]